MDLESCLKLMLLGVCASVKLNTEVKLESAEEYRRGSRAVESVQFPTFRCCVVLWMRCLQPNCEFASYWQCKHCSLYDRCLE